MSVKKVWMSKYHCLKWKFIWHHFTTIWHLCI